jgi:glycosyltransferase involved in cell wall biosynthesis
MYVAVSAQFDPHQTGGVQSNVFSLLRGIDCSTTGFKLAVLTAPAHVNEFQPYLRGGAKPVPWKQGVEVPISGFRPSVRELAIKRRIGRLAPLFSVVLYVYRRTRYGRPPEQSPSMRKADRTLQRLQVGMVHFPTPQLFKTSLPFVYEPWDLLFWHYPDLFDATEREFRERTYRYGCENAAIVVTATRWVKDDIVRQFGLSPERVAVIRRGSEYARLALSEEQVDTILRGYGLAPGYFLFPAMSFQHKNHLLLFRALAWMRDAKGVHARLVLTGRRFAPYWPTLEKALAEYALEGQVRVLNAVSEATLTALYRRCRALVFPSLFEGLGLPLLEALHHRVPVLASSETSIPEVLGRAAHYFDAHDHVSIAAAMHRAMCEPRWLESVQEHAASRLEEFNWDRASKTFLALYKQVLGTELSEEDRALMKAAMA